MNENCECTARGMGIAGKVRINFCPLHANAGKTLTTLKLAKDAIVRLITGIEQHHATSACQSEAIFGMADREYKILDTIRQAIIEAERKGP